MIYVQCEEHRWRGYLPFLNMNIMIEEFVAFWRLIQGTQAGVCQHATVQRDLTKANATSLSKGLFVNILEPYDAHSRHTLGPPHRWESSGFSAFSRNLQQIVTDRTRNIYIRLSPSITTARKGKESSSETSLNNPPSFHHSNLNS